MAASPRNSDFNEVEDFDEYNPHPYQGGYDIALTYGQPLPPSPAICYPISPPPSSSPSSESVPSVPAGNGGASEPRADSEGGEPARGSDYAGEDWGRGYDIGWSEDGYSPGEAGAYLGYWPFPVQEFDGSRGRRDSGQQDILNSAADYLFGYLRMYGEKRDESHNYGNLNYAYERHHRQEPPLIQFSPQEPSWCGKPSYDEDPQEEIYPNAGYGFGHGRDGPEGTYSEIVCVGNSYHEDYSIEVYPQSEGSYAYERCYYEEPLSVQHLQVEQTWSQKPSFLEFYESHVPNPPEDVHTYGNKLHEQPLDVFDFTDKSWYQMLNNNEPGEVNSYPLLKTHVDSWNETEEQSYFSFLE